MQEFRKNIYRLSMSVTSFSFDFSIGQSSEGLACMETSYPITLYSADSIIVIDSQFYTESELSIEFNGMDKWYKNGNYSYKIGITGIVLEISILCSMLLPLIRYCYKGLYTPPDPIHIPPGGEVYYEDEYGDPQTRTNITTESGIVSIFSSSIPTDNGAAYLADCETGDPI